MPPRHDVRASDAEREKVATALRDHAGDGRLDPEELEKRLDLAYAARTRGDLVPLLADLPSEDEEKRPRPRSDEPGPLPPLVFVSLVLIVIWAFSGAGYFWPMWPIGAMVLAAIGSRGRHHHHGPPRRRSESP